MKISKSFVTVFFCALVLFLSQSVFARTNLDAFALAVDHFGQGNKKQIEEYSEEHKYMIALLNQIKDEYPELASISKVPDVELGMDEMQMRPYFDVISENRIYGGADGPKNKKTELKNILKEIENIFTGCPFSRTVTEVYLNKKSEKPTKKSILTRYFININQNPKDKTCENNVANKLAGFGVESFRVEEIIDTFDFIPYQLNLKLSFIGLTHINYVLPELSKLKGFENIANKLSGVEYFIGRNTDITVVKSQGDGQPDEGVTLQFTMGFGDCMAGCINKKIWIIDAKQKLSSGDESENFVFDLSAEIKGNTNIFDAL